MSKIFPAWVSKTYLKFSKMQLWSLEDENYYKIAIMDVDTAKKVFLEVCDAFMSYCDRDEWTQYYDDNETTLFADEDELIYHGVEAISHDISTNIGIDYDEALMYLKKFNEGWRKCFRGHSKIKFNWREK